MFHVKHELPKLTMPEATYLFCLYLAFMAKKERETAPTNLLNVRSIRTIYLCAIIAGFVNDFNPQFNIIRQNLLRISA
jgi:hypothetical protein